MLELAELDAIAAETSFSGVVRIDRPDGTEETKAYGLAYRSAWPIARFLAERLAA